MGAWVFYKGVKQIYDIQIPKKILDILNMEVPGLPIELGAFMPEWRKEND